MAAFPQLKQELATRFRALAAGLGYLPGPSLTEAGRSGSHWWFFRDGRVFPTEALWFSLVPKPAPWFSVDFVGSPFSVEHLRKYGWPGRAGVMGLFAFQVDHLKKPVASVHPEEVILPDDAAEIETVFSQLSEEMEAVDQRLWEVLAQRSVREMPEWADRLRLPSR